MQNSIFYNTYYVYQIYFSVQYMWRNKNKNKNSGQ